MHFLAIIFAQMSKVSRKESFESLKLKTTSNTLETQVDLMNFSEYLFEHEHRFHPARAELS